MKKGWPIGAIAALVSGLGTPGRARSGKWSRHEQAQSLLDLAQELQSILVRVQPKAEFRRRLQGELILEAQRREENFKPTAFQQRRTGILIGAAALGSLASVAGVIIAYVLHNRSGRATHAAGG